MKAPSIVMPLVIWICLGFAPHADAQSAERRFEVAGQADLLRLSDFHATSAGFGARVSFDLADWAALEGEVSFFPHDNISGKETVTSEGPFHVVNLRSRTDVLGGVKVGRRGERLGAFLKSAAGPDAAGGQGDGVRRTRV